VPALVVQMSSNMGGHRRFDSAFMIWLSTAFMLRTWCRTVSSWLSLSRGHFFVREPRFVPLAASCPLFFLGAFGARHPQPDTWAAHRRGDSAGFFLSLFNGFVFGMLLVLRFIW
jgi:hypothetical protein